MTFDDAGTTLAANAPAVIGGRYELLGLLGTGGMGTVYRVRDRELDEVVALKLVRPELLVGANALDRFRREVKLARRVTHPNVARVYDIGELGADRILTMELVEGESLGDLLRREGRLPLARACEIACAVCAGLAAAHAAGVVHRDVKPENVLIGREGRVVVTDFGIARALADGGRTQGLVGTPAYMAPEQIDERASIDHRVDVYAFGVMLFELLTGQLPWRADSLWALAAARLLDGPPDPRTLCPELPEPLAAIVLGCMAREPDARVASLTEVEARLRQLQLPAGPGSTPVAPVGRALVQTTGRRRRVAVLPFDNLGAPEDDYIADGVTEDLIDGLSLAPGLRVRSRRVVARYRGSELDPRELGAELGVDVVVEGSIRTTAAGHRISARLINVDDGFQVWARRFDVPAAELLIEVDAIVRAIAEALTVELDIPERPAADGEAVELYLRARDAYRRCFSGDREAPLRLYEQLLARTPDDPRVLAGLAMAGAAQLFWTPQQRQAALDAAARAIELAPNLAEGHHALALVRIMNGDNLRAIAPLRRALRLAPSSAEAHCLLGSTYLAADQLERARPHLEAAIRLEPTYELPYVQLSAYHEYRGERERGAELLERCHALGLGIAGPLELRLCLWRRDWARARELLATVVPSQPIAAFVAAQLRSLVAGEPPPRGLPATPAGTERPKVVLWAHLQTEVEIACVLGDLDDALACLHRYVDAGGDNLAWFRHLALLEPLRRATASSPARERIEQRVAALTAVLSEPTVAPASGD